MIGQIVYILCTITSLAVAVILLRNYSRTAVRFLLWSGLCFVGLAAGNLLLFVDMIVYPGGDLSIYRTLPAVMGFGVLIYGFIWDVV